MKTTIEINIPKKGTMVGTCGYVANYLKTAKLTIKIVDNRPAIVAEFESYNNEIVIAKVPSNFSGDLKYNLFSDLCILAPGETDENIRLEKNTLFGYLTPAAWIYTLTFIEKCADALNSYLESDKFIEDEIILKIYTNEKTKQ